jgi:hypothetical protein
VASEAGVDAYPICASDICGDDKSRRQRVDIQGRADDFMPALDPTTLFLELTPKGVSAAEMMNCQKMKKMLRRT